MDSDVLTGILSPCGHDTSNEGELRALRERRLRSQVGTAYRSVKFWHELLERAGLKPQQIVRVEDLRRLPLVSKRDLVSLELRDRLASSPKKLVRMFTSGTTGPPMEVYYSRAFVLSTAAYLHGHFREWFGLGRFYRVVQLSHHQAATPGPTAQASRPRISKRMRIGYSVLRPAIEKFARPVYFGSAIDEAIPAIEDFSPDMIMAKVSYLRLLADHAERRGRPFISPKVLVSTGEPLDEPTREYIESRLGAPVRQMYGSNETGPLALECMEGRGLHLFADRAIVEVLSETGEPVGPGELGEFVVTELTNGGMPLIRYRMQDVGYWSARRCSCGRSLPLLGSVEGRRIDCIDAQDGSLVTPKRVLALMHSAKAVPRCQLVQRSRGSLVLRILAGAAADDPEARDSVSALVESLKREVGPDPRISVQWDVPAGEVPGSKARPVIVESLS